MFRRIKNIIMSAILAGAMVVPAVPVMVGAQTEANIEGSLCVGASLDAGAADTCDQAQVDQSQQTVGNLIKQVINIFSVIVGVVSVIMIIIGGLKYITSGGDSGNVTGAKNTILYAIIGLVVVALSQIIVRFVLSKVNTATTT